MKRIIPVCAMLSLIVAIIFIFFEKNNNIEKIGNNKIKDLQDYILQINSYEATTQITINSNKTINNYKVKQKESVGKSFEQEIIEPEIIARYNI